MVHNNGVCPKHRHLNRSVIDCDDCKEAQREQLKAEAGAY